MVENEYHSYFMEKGKVIMNRIGLLSAFMIAAVFLLGASFWKQMLAGPTEEVEAEPGILIVAHGGGPAWDRQIMKSVAPFAREHMVEVGFMTALAGSPSMNDAYPRTAAITTRYSTTSGSLMRYRHEKERGCRIRIRVNGTNRWN